MELRSFVVVMNFVSNVFLSFTLDITISHEHFKKWYHGNQVKSCELSFNERVIENVRILDLHFRDYINPRKRQNFWTIHADNFRGNI